MTTDTNRTLTVSDEVLARRYADGQASAAEVVVQMERARRLVRCAELGVPVLSLRDAFIEAFIGKGDRA